MKLALLATLCLSGVVALSGTPRVAAWWGQPTPKQAEPGGPAKDVFEKRLDEIDARAKEISTLRARFVQKKHTPLLKKPMDSSGTVVMKGDKTRWETVEPRKSVMTIYGGSLRIFFPDQRVVEVYDLGEDVREFSASPIPELSKLRASFDISQVKTSEAGGRDDDGTALGIELLPRTEELKKHVERVRVLIDTDVPTAKRIEIVDVDGERTEIEFRDIEVNKPVEEAEVSLEVPAGTREVHPLGESEAKKPKEPGK